MVNFLRVLFSSLVLFTGAAFADDDGTYWTYSGDPDPKPKYGSATAACSNANYDPWFFSHIFDESQGAGTKYGCIVKNSIGQDSRHFWASKQSCPDGTVFNEDTGQCEAPSQCEAGDSSSFEFHYCYDYDGTDTCVNKKTRPSTFCQNSCVFVPDYNPETSDADCYAYQNGDGTSGPSVFCSVTAFANGSQCSGDYSPDSPDNSCPSGTVASVVNGKNVCVPSGGGDGGDGGDNGGGDGGDNGGENGGDNGGGDGGDNGGGDGDGTSGNGNGNGNGGNGDGTGGNGDGTGGTGTGGDGNGDGDGEGDGSGSAEGVDNCESGRCDFGDDRGDPFDGEVRSFSESLTAAMTGMKNSPLGNSIGNIQFPTGGTCPTGSTSIATPFGSMSIDFESHCTLWEQIAPILSAVFLAFWAILAVRVFLSA